MPGPEQGLAAGHRPVKAGRDIRRPHREPSGDVGHFDGLAEGVAGVQRPAVGAGQVRPGGEFLVQPVDGRLPVAGVHPIDQTQGPQVPAAQRLLLRQAEFLDRVEGHLRDVDGDGAVLVQAAVFQRIRLVAGLVQVALGKGAAVHDDHAARPQVRDLDHQRRRVHGDQQVHRVAGGLDHPGAEIDLKSGDTEGRPYRRPDFRRKVGVGGQVVAGQRRGLGELAAGELHAVAGISGKADDGRVQFLAGRPGGV